RAPGRRGDDAAGDEVAEGKPPAVAEVRKAVEVVVLVSVLDPDGAACDRAGDGDRGLEPDVVARELRLVPGHARQVIVVVSGEKCAPQARSGVAQLTEERRVHRGDRLELRHALAIRQLPEAERVADDDELRGER